MTYQIHLTITDRVMIHEQLEWVFSVLTPVVHRNEILHFDESLVERIYIIWIFLFAHTERVYIYDSVSSYMHTLWGKFDWENLHYNVSYMHTLWGHILKHSGVKRMQPVWLCILSGMWFEALKGNTWYCSLMQFKSQVFVNIFLCSDTNEVSDVVSTIWLTKDEWWNPDALILEYFNSCALIDNESSCFFSINDLSSVVSLVF